MNKIALAILSLAGVTLAQTQWSVGPGGFAQIRDVMPLVASGDTVVVAPGSYFPFDCERGVTIRAQTPGTVTVAFSLLALPPTCGCTCLQSQGPVRFAIPAGQTAHLVGLRFASFSLFTPCFTSIRQVLRVDGGRVTMDECAVDALIVQNAAVHLQDCDVTSDFGGPGLSATGADVTIAGGSITGAPAVSMTGAQLHANGVAITGTGAAAGITATGGSLWLADSSVTAGASACAVSASGAVRIDRSTLSAGGVGCLVSPTGAPLVGIDRSGAITIGQVFQVTLASEPGALLILFGSTALGAPLVASLVEQPVWIDMGPLFLADVAIAAAAQTTFTYPIPPAPTLVGSSFWLQGVGGTTFPLQTTAVVGGLVR